MHFDASSLRAPGDAAAVASAEAWLADEVAIDFPSLRPIVERMRAAFLGGDPGVGEPLSAVLRLTPRQATRGGWIPVDVPVRQVCRQCGGRGEVWGDGCHACAGRGDCVHQRSVDVHVPAGVSDGACLAFSVGPSHGLSTRVHLRVAVR